MSTTTTTVATGATGATPNRFIRGVVFFNEKMHIGFEDTSPCPADQEEVCIVGDISNSMNLVQVQTKLKLILAEQTKGTNAENKFAIPTPSGSTAMVDAVAECTRRWPEATIEVTGDGVDNHAHGNLVIDIDDHGNEINATIDRANFSSDENVKNVAKHLANAHGAKLFYISLDVAANGLAEGLAEAGVQTATVNTTASAAQVVATYRAGRAAHRAHRAANPSSTPRTSNRPSGTRVVIHTSDEVNAIVASLPDTEVGEVERAAGFIHVVSANDATKEEMKGAIDTAIGVVDVKDEHKPMVRAAILFYMLTIVGAMQAVPAAMLFGKYCGVFKEPANSDIKKSVNKVLNRLSGKGGPNIISPGGTVPKDGASMKINGIWIKFPECPMYTCTAKKDFIEELMAESDWAAPMDAFEKTKHSPKKRAREGPDEAGAQPIAPPPSPTPPVDPGASALSEAEATAAAIVEA